MTFALFGINFDFALFLNYFLFWFSLNERIDLMIEIVNVVNERNGSLWLLLWKMHV